MAKGYSLAALAENLYKMVFPVGICVDFINTTDPNVVFPGTTWVRDRSGASYRSAPADKDIGFVFGTDTITLSQSQLPPHSHRHDHFHAMDHGHPRTWTNLNGEHEHRVIGNTSSDGGHVHYMGGRSSAGGGSFVVTGNGGNATGLNTSGAGEHSHWFDVTAWGAGNHDHYLDIQQHLGPTKWVSEQGSSNNVFTEDTGGGQQIGIVPYTKHYARWERTA